VEVRTASSRPGRGHFVVAARPHREETGEEHRRVGDAVPVEDGALQAEEAEGVEEHALSLEEQLVDAEEVAAAAKFDGEGVSRLFGREFDDDGLWCDWSGERREKSHLDCLIFLSRKELSGCDFDNVEKKRKVASPEDFYGQIT
jgi:hypothetical protein